jgi:hypothetical protein
MLALLFFALASPERRNFGKMSTKSLGVSQYNTGYREPLFVPEVRDVHSRSLETSRSRVGIAEWDDTG